MRSVTRSLGAVLAAVALVLGAGAAQGSGPAWDGMHGLLRVHSADMGTPGYMAGSLYGSHTRIFLSPEESWRGQGEKVHFAGARLSVSYTPTPYVELSVNTWGENQFVSTTVGDASASQFGIGDVDFGVKTLLTPSSQKTWRLGGELHISTSTGDTNALVGSWDSDGFDIAGQLNLTYSHEREEGRPAFRAHLNTGYLNRTGEFDELAWALTSIGRTPPHLVLHGDQFLYGLGLEVPAPQNWAFFAEWTGEYDIDAEADFADNPMRVAPGLRWASPSGAFSWTTAYEFTVSSEESAPSGQLVTGFTLGGYVAPVRGMLYGSVRDAQTGEAISGVRVSVRNSQMEPFVTDGDGKFWGEIEEGYAVLELEADGYNSKTRVVEVKGHGSQEYDFTLAERIVFGTVQGRLRDSETGTPVFGRVRVAGTENWTEADPASGAFVLERVPEGTTQLEAMAKNYTSTTVMARVQAGEVNAQDFSLSRDWEAMAGVLSGYVRDVQNGKALAATVTARGQKNRSAKVDPATGLYEIQLEPGTYSISVTSQGYLAKVEPVTVVEHEAVVRNFDLMSLPEKLTLKGVFFDSGTATIKRESLAVLGEAAGFLLENPSLEVVIRGHTDNMGTEELNQALSQRRADAVMKYLVVNHGIDPKRLTAEGIGPAEPVASNDTAEGRALNRRIEFQIEEGVATQKK